MALASVALLSFFRLLPGVDRLVPYTPVTFVALATAVVTVAVVVLLAYAAPRFAALTRTRFEKVVVESGTGAGVEANPKPLVEHAAAVVYWLTLFTAVIIANRGLEGVSAPFLGDFVWAYDAVFLIAALVPLVFVTARVAAAVGPLSTAIADRVVGRAPGSPDGR
ncbi:hypothetical protein [Halorubrum sp. JWXQ-INN 858]|uniref:hypothetical protein n=1 Tax=Halorubrum sp. JWXQ-INN 858 TaxID=2690782 RepID=UPI002AA2A8E3|nr:hypothetical protein [Halorubrum sp. JWXQ-INN 858]